jgi:hypothetical protein
LKRFVEFEKPDQAYLVLLDRDGNVRWRWHGLFGEVEYGRLREQLHGLHPNGASGPGT